MRSASSDVYKRQPLAKVMRTECRKRRIKHLKVVYSREPVMTPIEDDSISCKDHLSLIHISPLQHSGRGSWKPTAYAAG